MELIPVTTDAQIEQVAALAREIWTEHFTPIIGPAQVEYMLANIQSAEAITRQIRTDGYRYFRLDHDNTPIGYTAIQLRPQELFLSKLYIKKIHRNHGLGRAALHHIETIARENNRSVITLTVNKYNTATIAVYEKMGFTVCGPIVADIGSGFIMDDYKMQKNLH